jgi:hypothetical protein
VLSEPIKLASGKRLPRGCLVRYREFYGCRPDKPNTGLKMHAVAVGKELAKLEKDDPGITYGVLDPATFAEDGGPSIAEEITRGSGNTVFWIKADNRRVTLRGAMGGWDQLRARMVGDEGLPMIVCFSTCLDSIRTIPALQHDRHRPEDLDSDGEDHAADEWRYAAMSRPWVPASDKPKADRTKRRDWFAEDEDEDMVDDWKVA